MQQDKRLEEAVKMLAYGMLEQHEKYLQDHGWSRTRTPIEQDGFIDPVTKEVHEPTVAYNIARIRIIMETLKKREDSNG